MSLPNNYIKVLIADDHQMVRKGLVGYLQTEDDIEVVGEAENGLEAIALCKKLTPDVVLMDLVMDQVDGIEATKQIKQLYPEMQIIILTSFIDEKQIFP